MLELTSRTCPRCKKDNGSVSSFCAQPGPPLDLKAVKDFQVRENVMAQILEQFMKNEEVWALLNISSEKQPFE